MTLQEIYDVALRMGIKADPRGEKGVAKFLKTRKKEYEELPGKKKKGFDTESLRNPYSDSRILYGDQKTHVKKVMAGIDGDESDILLADRLRGKGEKVDIVISHHPSGHAFAALHEVLDMQVDMYHEAGVPVNVAHALFEERKGKVKRGIAPLNHSKAVDTARLLDIPLLALHTIWDNLGKKFMEEYLGGKSFDTVGEILEKVNELPEFVESTKGKSGPSIVSGSAKARAGKIFIGFTGGTNPSKEAYKELAKAGIGTIVDMHISEHTLTELKKLHINVIDTGHIAADSIGANIFLDELEKRGVAIIPSSGLIRVRRKK